jgi:hypothetical protein
MAGNVMIYLTPGSEADVIANMARHLDIDGRLVAGFQLLSNGLSTEPYDRLCEDAGLMLEHRYATWDGVAWRAGGNYAVSVHRR